MASLQVADSLAIFSKKILTTGMNFVERCNNNSEFIQKIVLSNEATFCLLTGVITKWR